MRDEAMSDSREHRNNRRPGWLSKLLRLFTVTGLAFVLTACGAEISTVLTVETDGSGSREILLVLDESDLENVKGGSAALEASIVERVPDDLDYSGISQNAEGGLEATFVLEFSSTEEYVEKIDALLGLSDDSIATPKLEVIDSKLVNGVIIEEEFTSYDLLAWLFDGLVEDGVIDGSQGTSNLYSLGTTVVEFDGTTHESWADINENITVNNGFSQVKMATQIIDLDNVERQIMFVSGSGPEELYQSYFDEVLADGLDVVHEGNRWSVEVSGTPEEITNLTNTVLSTDDAYFSVESGPSERGPAVVQVTVANEATCDKICGSDVMQLFDEVTAPSSFSPGSAEVWLQPGTSTAFEYAPAFESIDQKVQIDANGSVNAKTEFTVAASDAALVGDGFEMLLSPGEAAGSLQAREDGDNVVYTVEIAGDNADDFQGSYQSWTDGGEFNLSTTQPSLFESATHVWFNPSLAPLVAQHGVTGQVVTEVGVPFPQSVQNGSAISHNGEPVTLYASGMSQTGIVLTVIIGLIVIGAVTLVIIRPTWLRNLVVSTTGGTAARVKPVAVPNPLGHDIRQPDRRVGGEPRTSSTEAEPIQQHPSQESSGGSGRIQ